MAVVDADKSRVDDGAANDADQRIEKTIVEGLGIRIAVDGEILKRENRVIRVLNVTFLVNYAPCSLRLCTMDKRLESTNDCIT